MPMNITNQVFEQDRASLTIENSSIPVVNAIRRSMLCDIPMIAVSKVHITKNNTPMPDDMLSHRIGLIPIYIDTSIDLENVHLYIDKSGPCELYSDDISCTSDLIRIVKGVFICPLYNDQHIKLKGDIEIGTGKQHARFQRSVAPCYYMTHKGISTPECFCANTTLDTKCERCGKNKQPLDVQQRPIVYNLTFESIGGISTTDLLTQSIQVLMAKLQNMAITINQLEDID
tara:strand:- start:555 stop:1244 length:690 start_codon:yes stop_codon:yes gene_type:complete